MSKYPLAPEVLAEEYSDLLIKIGLREYMKEQARLLEQEEAEAAPVPAPKGNVVAAAFRQVNLEDAKETILSGLKKGVTRVAVVLLAAAITFTTAFAVSDTVKESVLKKLQSSSITTPPSSRIPLGRRPNPASGMMTFPLSRCQTMAYSRLWRSGQVSATADNLSALSLLKFPPWCRCSGICAVVMAATCYTAIPPVHGSLPKRWSALRSITLG